MPEAPSLQGCSGPSRMAAELSSQALESMLAMEDCGVSRGSEAQISHEAELPG